MALNLGFNGAVGAASGPDFTNLFQAAPAAVEQKRDAEARAGRFPVLAARANSTGPTAHLFMDAEDEDFQFAASIIDACVSTTVYAIQCTSHPLSMYRTACNPTAPIFTVTQEPEHYRISTDITVMTQGVEVKGSLEENCDLKGTTSVSCSGTVYASAQKTKTSTTVSFTATGTNVYYYDVAITGGAEKTASPTACSGKKSAAAGLNVRGVVGLAVLGALGAGAFLGF